jgi:hypothetical protein
MIIFSESEKYADFLQIIPVIGFGSSRGLRLRYCSYLLPIQAILIDFPEENHPRKPLTILLFWIMMEEKK